jgi:undecaprenyl diphosphate synthase
MQKEQKELPKHITVIPDGNRRWAKKKGLPRLEGHRKGQDAISKIIKRAGDLGIHTLTFWGFSTENWRRDKSEIDFLMDLFETRIIHLGRKDRIPPSLQKKIIDAEEKTRKFTKHTLNIALDYGGQDELVRAASKIAREVRDNNLATEEICCEKFNNYLDTKEQLYPYPDLVIRTSGEKRLSGFLSWQLAYAELYFSDLEMPDFGPDQLEDAINDYMGRERRFGGNK